MHIKFPMGAVDDIARYIPRLIKEVKETFGDNDDKKGGSVREKSYNIGAYSVRITKKDTTANNCKSSVSYDSTPTNLLYDIYA